MLVSIRDGLPGIWCRAAACQSSGRPSRRHRTILFRSIAWLSRHNSPHGQPNGRRPGSGCASIRRVDALLGTCALAALRQRRSFKWRTYPADVLPAFVAEMDFDLAQPIIGAVTAALALGDCGYGHTGRWARRSPRSPRTGSAGRPDPARVFAIPDVMTGLAEVIQALTPPGAGMVINPPVYPPFWFRFGFSGRRIVEAPLAVDADGRYTLTRTRWTRAQPAGRRRVPAVQPAQPDRQRVASGAAADGGRPVPAPRCRRWWWTRSTRRWCWPGAATCRSCPSTTR